MKDEYLTERNFDEELHEEYLAYLMRSAKPAEREIKLMDELSAEKYKVELELYHRQ